MPDGKRGPLPNTWGGSRPGQSGRAADKLPDYAMPPFDGIGANEYIVAAPNDACDFISTVDTPAVWELNIWYHVLNTGLKTRISGETDFPCIYGERVGLGRVYVQMDPKLPMTYDQWVRGLLDGRSYVGDGASHVRKFAVNEHQLGQIDAERRVSEIHLNKPEKVQVTASLATFLTATPTEEALQIKNRRLDEKPYWHIERSRIGTSRTVPVELIVNGQAVAKQDLTADGNWNDLQWEVQVEQSSWIALRIFPSMHTNPIFVHVDQKPIQPSKLSAQWCRDAVDVCWNKKSPLIRAEERDAAQAAYNIAREYYDRAIQAALAQTAPAP
jgi:hypothetical protein